MTKNLLITLAILMICVFSNPVYASLVDHGNGLVYDTVLNITWLSDANYAMTSGYDSDGRMTWSEAMTWVNQLNYQGYTGWRLPSGLRFDGSMGPDGWSVLDTEFDHLREMELGIPWNEPPYVREYPSLGLFTNYWPVGGGQFWTSTIANPGEPDSSLIVWYWFDFGEYWWLPQDRLEYAWAVHDGNIGAAHAPIPGAVFLFAPGLVGLAVLRRKFFGSTGR